MRLPVEQAPPLSFVLLKAPLSDPRLRRFRPEFPLLPNLHDLGWELPDSTTPFVCPETVGVTADGIRFIELLFYPKSVKETSNFVKRYSRWQNFPFPFSRTQAFYPAERSARRRAAEAAAQQSEKAFQLQQKDPVPKKQRFNSVIKADEASNYHLILRFFAVKAKDFSEQTLYRPFNAFLTVSVI